MCASLICYITEMKHIIFFILFIITTFDCGAQSAHNRYSSRLTPDGMCYFFRQIEISKLEGISKFEYDMTYLDRNDSVTVNFTIHSPAPNSPKVTHIKSGNNTFTCEKTERYFVDITKKGYVIRSSAKFHKNEIDKIVFCTSAPVFYFKLGAADASATYTESAWKKDSKKLQNILNLIYSTKQ